jgi:phospholipase C
MEKRIKTTAAILGVVAIIITTSIVYIYTYWNPGNPHANQVPANLTATGIKHVIVIMEENQPYSSIAGSSQAPYENQLAASYALMSNYYAVAHPSLPNYLAITGGSTFGITADCNPSVCSITQANIVNLLNAKGLSWKGYFESMTQPCSTAETKLYDPDHNPFVYYTQISGNPTYCNTHVVSYEDPANGFLYDLNHNSLPNFSFIVPNQCDDGHDTSLDNPSCSNPNGVNAADSWLATLVPKIIGSPYFFSTIIFIVYDEATPYSSPNHVFCLLVSPVAKEGYISTVRYNHYSLLSTIEAIFSTGSLGRMDVTPPMVDGLNITLTSVLPRVPTFSPYFLALGQFSLPVYRSSPPFPNVVRHSEISSALACNFLDIHQFK